MVLALFLVEVEFADLGACCDAIREESFFLFLFFGEALLLLVVVAVRVAVLICIKEKMRSLRAAFSSLILFKSPRKSAIVLLRLAITARRLERSDGLMDG